MRLSLVEFLAFTEQNIVDIVPLRTKGPAAIERHAARPTIILPKFIVIAVMG
ncbi:hypothetical protein D3C80_2013830 [compost metagenome]